MSQLYFLNDNTLVVKRFRASATGDFINDGVWEANLYNPTSGEAIPGGTGISLGYTSGSDGEYRGVVDSDVVLTLGSRVKVVATCSNYRSRIVRILPVVERSA